MKEKKPHRDIERHRVCMQLLFEALLQTYVNFFSKCKKFSMNSYVSMWFKKLAYSIGGKKPHCDIERHRTKTKSLFETQFQTDVNYFLICKKVSMSNYVSMWFKFLTRLGFHVPAVGLLRVTLLCLITLPVASQYNSNFMNYNKTGRCVGVNSEYDAGSNGMSTQMVNKLIWGGYIDSKLKDESAKHLKASNNMGLQLNYGVSAFLKGGKSWDYLIAAKGHEVLNSRYSRDFYQLMFNGNGDYKGRLADLSNCNINALRFQELKIGAIFHHVDSVARMGVSISFLKGEQFFYIKTNKNSNLYTAADGSELVFNSNFNMAISDTNSKKVADFNGVGASADLFFETMYKTRFGKYCLLTVTANNLGFIHWFDNSAQYSSDSTLTFTGYNIYDLNDLKDSTLNQINNDSLFRDLSNAHSGSFNVNIPSNLVMINKIYFNKAANLSIGFRQIFNANYRPYFFLEPEYTVKEMTFALHTGYGGYVKLNIGASVTWNSDKWYIKVGSNALQGYFAKKTVFSQSIFISLAKKLK